MKVTILISFFLISSWEIAASCLPDSQEKNLDLDYEITSLERLANNFESMVVKILPTDIDLSIQFQTLNPRVNAEITKSAQTITIVVMGGMLAHSEMNDNALTLLLCHELGHFLGGPPLKSRGGWSSTEGQADYFSGATCARSIGIQEADFLDGAVRLTTIYAQSMKEPEPKISQCDQTRVQRTIFGYPSVQCRLDSILAGWQGNGRPVCWYFE
jgi:hypothetical protein